jgi:NAD/NADP transhydrogenase beta subunit
MPAVIYFYNASTGLAIGLEGFVLRSPTLIIAGILVSTARMLFTLTMVKLSVTDAYKTDGDAIQQMLRPI